VEGVTDAVVLEDEAIVARKTVTRRKMRINLLPLAAKEKAVAVVVGVTEDAVDVAMARLRAAMARDVDTVRNAMDVAVPADAAGPMALDEVDIPGLGITVHLDSDLPLLLLMDLMDPGIMAARLLTQDVAEGDGAVVAGLSVVAFLIP